MRNVNKAPSIKLSYHSYYIFPGLLNDAIDIKLMAFLNFGQIIAKEESRQHRGKCCNCEKFTLLACWLLLTVPLATA